MNEMKKHWVEEYDDELKAAFRESDAARRISHFINAMNARREGLCRDLVQANDDNLLRAIRGEISFCIELADGAKLALEAEEAKAKADAAKGIPESLR